MSRIVCSRCNRPAKGCICAFFTEVENVTDVVILQHPQEADQTKGTATLLTQSLTRCQLILGENFTENKPLNSLISDPDRQVVLLYPSESALQISTYQQQAQQKITDKPKKLTLLLLDATWKKAYRMYMLSQNLHNLPHVTLPSSIQGQYDIRSTQKKNALSTLEACVHALSIVESDHAKYEQLLENFVSFNQFQLGFRAKSSLV